MPPRPLALRRAQHTLTDLYGYRGFGCLPEIEEPHCVALVDGRPAVLVWWAEGVDEPRKLMLHTAALLGDRDDVGFIWAVNTGAAGDGLPMRVGPDGVMAIERLPDADAFRATPIHTPLDGVDWSRLQDAYGSATVTRDHLETLLTAADPAERADAVYRLYLGLCHQAVSLSQATAPAIPFLISAGERTDAVDVLQLLTDIAELAGLPLDDVPDEEAAWSRRCAMMLGAGAERIAAWVRGAKGNLRRAAALRLALAVRRVAPGSARALDTVLDRARVDPAPTMRLLAVRALSADGERQRLRAALDDPELKVRAFAALPLLKDPDDDLRARAWDAVHEALADLERVERWIDPPEDEEDAPDLAAPVEVLEAVAAAGRPLAERVLDRLIDLLATEKEGTRLGPIVRVFWPDRRVPAADAVDVAQAAALAALARNRRFWRKGDRHVLPAPFDAETEWREFRDRIAELPALAELPPERAAVDFGERPPDELADEIVRDVVTGADGDLAQMGAHITRLRLGPELCDAVLETLCAACIRLEELELDRPRIARLTPLAGLKRLRVLRLIGLEHLESPDPLAPLAEAKFLRQLTLIDPGFGQSALRPLARLPRLAQLSIVRMEMLGGGLAALGPAPRLKELSLSGPLPSAAWRALPALERLRILRLCELTVPRAGLAGWGGSALERLTFDGCVVPPGALSDLPTLPTLRRVVFFGCAVHDAELAALARLPRLSDVEVVRTPLGAGAVEVLAGIGTHIRLSLVETGLSETAIRDLRRRRRAR